MLQHKQGDAQIRSNDLKAFLNANELQNVFLFTRPIGARLQGLPLNPFSVFVKVFPFPNVATKPAQSHEIIHDI